MLILISIIIFYHFNNSLLCVHSISLLPGFPSEFKGISYINSPVKGKFQWEFEIMMRDLDGSLSETGKKNSIVTPNMDILDKSSCTKTDSWSHGSVEGAVCDDKVNYIQVYTIYKYI